MEILIVAPMLPRPQAPGAIPLVLNAQLRGLAPHHTITLVTLAGPDPAEREGIDHLRKNGIDVRFVWRSEPSGLQRWQRRWRWASTWLQGRLPWRTIWFWEPGMQRILDTLLQKQSFDLVTIEDNAMGVYNYSTRAPLVFTEHEVRRPRPINWHAGVPSNWLRWVFCEADWYRWQRYQPLIWRRFDRVQVFTSRDAKAITALAPDLAWRVRINPFGIELPAPVDYSLEEEGNVLFVGNFTHPPNVDAALWLGAEIMPLLRTRYPGIRLTLVGIYPPKAVQALACDDIFVIGPVPEIEPFFKRAAVIVAPLRTGGGMRMKVLQAMALGKAVVTTHRGADGLSLTGQQPPLTIADSAEEIADAVKVLLESSNIRQSIGLRARDHVAEYFSAQAYARRIESIYAELRPGQGAP